MFLAALGVCLYDSYFVILRPHVNAISLLFVMPFFIVSLLFCNCIRHFLFHWLKPWSSFWSWRPLASDCSHASCALCVLSSACCGLFVQAYSRFKSSGNDI